MKRIVSYISSLVILVVGLYLSYDVPGVEKIFAIGGIIVGALIVGWIVQKVLEQLTDL
jgi:hypothetical protein